MKHFKMASSLAHCEWKYLECDLFILGILKCIFSDQICTDTIKYNYKCSWVLRHNGIYSSCPSVRLASSTQNFQDAIILTNILFSYFSIHFVKIE